jgi:hypothetical protein
MRKPRTRKLRIRKPSGGSREDEAGIDGDRFARRRSMVTLGWIVRSAVVAAVVLVVGTGCSAEKAATEKLAGPTAADGLTNLRDLFRQAAAGKATLPKSLAEFTALEPFYPVAGPFVLAGDISCVWGAGLKDGAEASKRVLAFETRAAKEGGWVMFQDGAIREVTSEEFAAAAKAAP